MIKPVSHASAIPKDAIDQAQKHIADILSLAIEYTDVHAAVVVYDERCDLAAALAEAYRRVLPKARFIDFDRVTQQSVLAEFEKLKPSDLVVLIQSTNFRLEAFRIRVELFKHSIKVIEHPHLGRMQGVEPLYYIDSLAYDADYYRGLGRGLKERIDQAGGGVVDSGGEKLVFASAFEPAKLNVGDYTGMRNVGGQFPIGEVFTEAKNLDAVNGRVRVCVFGDVTFTANKPDKPITLEVVRGRVAHVIDSNAEFDKVIANIRADEGEVWVRELGFGLNRALTAERIVRDIGTFERMCGVHLSLGAKHGLYKKAGFPDKTARHHVDIFAVTKTVTLGDAIVFQNGAWQA